MVTGSDLDLTHELEAAILRERGRVALEASDLDRARIDSAVARLSRVVARSQDAKDWFTGVRSTTVPRDGAETKSDTTSFPERC